MSVKKADISSLTLGFLGCGKISSCMVRGYASAPGSQRPVRILVSRRSEEKSAALAAEFPDLITICENEKLVEQSDVVFIGLLPPVARQLLPNLPWSTPAPSLEGSQKLIISMMAAVGIEELRSLVNIDHSRLVQTVPLPSTARRSGPILVYPSIASCISILDIVGTPVGCEREAEMRPLVSLTGHISSFFKLMQTSEQFMIDNGVGAEIARKFVSAFYASCATATEVSHHSLEEMAFEAATPGGLNEQAMGLLTSGEHFNAQRQSLQQVYDRLMGKFVYVKKP